MRWMFQAIIIIFSNLALYNVWAPATNTLSLDFLTSTHMAPTEITQREFIYLLLAANNNRNSDQSSLGQATSAAVIS